MTDTELIGAYDLARATCSPRTLMDLKRDHLAVRTRLREIQQKICILKCCHATFGAPDEFTSHHPDCDEIRDLFRPSK